MHDELDELQSANPVSLADAERRAALDRATLLDALERDAAGAVPIATRRRPRIGYLGAVAAVAAVFAPFAVLAVVDRGDQPDVVDEGLVPGSAVVIDPTVPPTTAVPATSDTGELNGASADATEASEAASVPTAAPTEPTAPATSPTSPTSPTSVPSVPVDDATIVPTRPVVAPTAESPVATTAPPTVPPTSVAPTTVPESRPDDADEPEATTAWPPIDGPIDREHDLLALHFDFAHLDDGHAAAAGRDLADHFGLDPFVVAGTQSSETSAFVHEYGPMMDATWGDTWLDAGGDRFAVVEAAAARWLVAIDAGGSVWIAEGGVSDFTAEVIREMQRLRPAVDTAASIHVVQHAERNENETRPDDLDLVLTATDYVRIDDGNDLNGTADLNGPSAEFETAALSGPAADRWASAFDYLSAAELDFSDTVAVLYIVGVGLDEVADATDFAVAFLR